MAAKSTKSKANKAKAIVAEDVAPVITKEVKVPEKGPVAEKPIVKPVTDEPVVDIAVKEIKPSIPKGVVVGCVRLNVRKAPSTSAPVVRILNANTIIPIYTKTTNGEWYETKGGFVMAKFIKIIN